MSLSVKRMLPMLALAICACSSGPSPAPDVRVGDVWARASLPGKPTSAAYFTLSNRGGPDELVGVTVSQATAEIHSTSMDGGIMRMRKLDSLPLPAASTVKLEPGGAHVMLMDLRQPLEPGGRIEITLRFEKSPERKVEGEIRSHSEGHE